MTAEELKETYEGFTNEELLKVIDNKFDHTELAVIIALAELSNRKVTEEDIKSFKENQMEEAITYIHQNITDDLSFIQKNLFYFIWLPFFTFPFKQNFRDDGYLLKLKQASYYSIIGFIFFILIGFISVIFNFTTLTSFGILILGFLPAYALDEIINRQHQIRQLKKDLNINDDDDDEGGL